MTAGDVNVKVPESKYSRGRQFNEVMEQVMGKHGTGVINSNGERLCEFC